MRQNCEQFQNALAAAGVEPSMSVGEEFDPELHEAVETDEAAEPEMDGRVIAEYSRGYPSVIDCCVRRESRSDALPKKQKQRDRISD